jgi:hypothetical protein
MVPLLTDDQARLLCLRAQRLVQPSSHAAERVQEIVKIDVLNSTNLLNKEGASTSIIKEL